MCLYVKQGRLPETARRDITCWKMVSSNFLTWRPIIYRVSRHKFPFNKICTALVDDAYELEHLCLERSWFRGGYYVEYGLHADLSFGIMRNICIIPRGAEMCYGANNDVVATRMIVFRSVIGYCVYRISKWIRSTFNK